MGIDVGDVTVIRSRKHLVWVMAACAAIAAQATPTAACFACDHPCCAVPNSGIEPHATAVNPESTGSCPLCASHADLLPGETEGQPCNCQLDARQEQPLAVSRDERKGDAALSCGLFCGGKRVASPFPGLSREYEALSQAIPIRPVRILFGVWRN